MAVQDGARILSTGHFDQITISLSFCSGQGSYGASHISGQGSYGASHISDASQSAYEPNPQWKSK